MRRRGAAAPLAVGLLRQLARAELAETEGQAGAALAELRAGLAMVHARRGRLGSIDLQTGTAALGADLAAAGLRLALDREVGAAGVRLAGTLACAGIPGAAGAAARRPPGRGRAG